MTALPQHLFANVRTVDDYRPSVTAIVLFGLEVEGEGLVYLEIRFEDYLGLKIEGDHLMLTLEEAMESAEHEYGISASDWRAMSQDEIDRIPFFIKGNKVV